MESRFNSLFFLIATWIACAVPSLNQCLTPVSAAETEESAPANVLLIITDEHNFRTLGCYREHMPEEQAEIWGSGAVVPTPHLDSLATDGVLCTRAYATAPVCSPCRAAMITGRYPHQAGVPTNNFVLDRSIPTLADRLNEAGYRTGFIGKWHLGGAGKPEWSPKVDGGFQFKRFMFNRGHWKKFALANEVPSVGSVKNGQPNYGVEGADETSFATDWLTDRALEFVSDAEATMPFFAVVSYPDPHGPNSVRPPYDHRFDNLPFQPPRTYQTGLAAPKWLGGGDNHPVFRGSDMSKYFGMVQCIDDNIGRLLARLEKDGTLDNTLILMTSDHGDLCYEHDRLNKGNPYEGSARVPMILRMPKTIRANQVYRDPVGTVDVTPTVIGLLGLPANEDDLGRDLSSILSNVPKADQKSTSPGRDPAITFLRNSGTKASWVAAVDRRYKLILSAADGPWLFDAEQDPDELLNFYLRPGTEGIAERLGESLQGYAQKSKDPFFADPNISASLATVLGKEPPTPSVDYHAQWKGSRRWIGPDWWANPLTDWSLRNGAVVAAAAADRTLCLLPADLSSSNRAFELTVNLRSFAKDGTKINQKTMAGFRLGRRGGIDDYRHALVHATEWFDAGLRGDGRLVLGENISEQVLPSGKSPVSLKLTAAPVGQSSQLTLVAQSDQGAIELTASLKSSKLTGGVALLSHGPSMPGGADPAVRHHFTDFTASGERLSFHPDRTFGPILWSQYTLQGDRLRLQAQLAPLGPNRNVAVDLWVADSDGDPQWGKVATVDMDHLSRTAAFTVDKWNPEKEKRYQVRMKWRNRVYAWEGTIRAEPDSSAPLKLGCFSCDNGYLFPIPAMVDQVTRQNPDMMFFAGDQIYENYGGFGVARRAETDIAMLDYLRKYYQFGWTWRDLLRDRPSVILPDDHDVFQGNLWGHGGRQLPEQAQGKDWTWGGYAMPSDWVAAIEKTNVGHLPDPATDQTLPIGIKPYYTRLTYGGVGFAILEDRKFKTGPKSLPEQDQPEGTGGELLGPQQEAFLEAWSKDWEGQTMKCALSQTIFCRAATHTGQQLKRTRGYYDSGAWPKEPRRRTVRLLGDCNAFAVHGDQHLGVLLRHGIDDFDDAGYAFMVPGTANGFPRAWWPGIPKGQLPKPDQSFLGKYHDSAGHPIHVLAVGNPEPESNLIKKAAGPMEIGYRKGSGYGMVLFDKQDLSVTVWLYRLGNRDELFDGFPQTLPIGGKPDPN